MWNVCKQLNMTTWRCDGAYSARGHVWMFEFEFQLEMAVSIWTFRNGALRLFYMPISCTYSFTFIWNAQTHASKVTARSAAAIGCWEPINGVAARSSALPPLLAILKCWRTEKKIIPQGIYVAVVALMIINAGKSMRNQYVMRLVVC